MDGYSRLIALLKVLLPLVALGILSTLFLLSRNSDPVAAIPFADADIQDRVQSQQVTGPYFSGATPTGDSVTISAEKILTQSDGSAQNKAFDIAAQFDLQGGTRVLLFSDTGSVSLENGAASLTGNVLVTTSTGFNLSTQLLTAKSDRLLIRAPSKVDGGGPFGTVSAGAMEISTPEGQENPHLLFTKGVTLIYKPQDDKE